MQKPQVHLKKSSLFSSQSVWCDILFCPSHDNSERPFTKYIFDRCLVMIFKRIWLIIRSKKYILFKRPLSKDNAHHKNVMRVNLSESQVSSSYMCFDGRKWMNINENHGNFSESQDKSAVMFVYTCIADGSGGPIFQLWLLLLFYVLLVKNVKELPRRK